MDFTPYIGTAVTIVIAFLSFYGAIAARFSRMETKVDNLAAQVEKHNSVVERTAVLERDMKTAYHHIDELKDRDEKIETRIDRLHD